MNTAGQLNTMGAYLPWDLQPMKGTLPLDSLCLCYEAPHLHDVCYKEVNLHIPTVILLLVDGVQVHDPGLRGSGDVQDEQTVVTGYPEHNEEDGFRTCEHLM
jgi:hypothetical protein